MCRTYIDPCRTRIVCRTYTGAEHVFAEHTSARAELALCAEHVSEPNIHHPRYCKNCFRFKSCKITNGDFEIYAMNSFLMDDVCFDNTRKRLPSYKKSLFTGLM